MTSRNKVFIVAKEVLNVNVRHDVKHRLCQFDVIHCIVQRITIHLHAKRCRNRQCFILNGCFRVWLDVEIKRFFHDSVNYDLTGN